MSLYKIGHLNSEKQRQAAEILLEKLKSFSPDTDLISLETDQTKDSVSLAINALLDHSCDVFCIDLTAIGRSLPPEVLIAGLSERPQHFDKILYNPQPDSEAPHIKLNDKASVVTYDKRTFGLARNLFPSWQLSLKEDKPVSIIQELKKFDGLILTNALLDEIPEDKNQFSAFQFHPKEFIPRPGQNVTAYLLRSEDKDFRKIINSIHISEVSQATNIERAIEQDLSNKGWDSIGVYCILDSNSHYHVHVCGKEKDDDVLKKCRYSSGTSENIVDNVFGLLSKND